MLCTAELHCAQLICVVNHSAQGGPMYNAYSMFVVDNEHANQGSQCSTVASNTSHCKDLDLYTV